MRVAAPAAPAVVVWGGPPTDERLAGLEAAYFDALGGVAGVRAERNGITVEAAGELSAWLGKPLRSTFAIDGTQTRTARQVVERLARNPYRSQPSDEEREAATAATLSWAQWRLGDAPVAFRVMRVHTSTGRGEPPDQAAKGTGAARQCPSRDRWGSAEADPVCRGDRI